MTAVSPNTLHRTAAFLTLGCAKNEVDTASMAASLSQAGISIVPMEAHPDVAIINTCAFIEAAVEESIDAILDTVSDIAEQDAATQLVVTGCLVSRYGKDLEETLPEVAAFVPCADEATLVSVIKKLMVTPKGVPPRLSAKSSSDTSDEPPILLSSHPSYEYVKISEGCNRRCAFCTIPSIRGAYRSFDQQSIEQAVLAAALRGAQEINLIAQDTGRWGIDLPGRPTLATLVRALDQRFENLWFRLLYIQPDGITDDLLEAIALSSSFCHYLDIPFQHVVGSILTSMGRSGNRETLRELCRHIRSKIPDVVLRTTMMVGYPGETEKDFDELCEFVAEGYFDYVGVFAFSPEDSTKAATLNNAVDEAVKMERWQTLRDLADSVCADRLQRFVGTTQTILVDGIDEGSLYGRTYFQAPEVDGLTWLDSGIIGRQCRVRLIDTIGYDFEGVRTDG